MSENAQGEGYILSMKSRGTKHRTVTNVFVEIATPAYYKEEACSQNIEAKT